MKNMQHFHKFDISSQTPLQFTFTAGHCETQTPQRWAARALRFKSVPLVCLRGAGPCRRLPKLLLSPCYPRSHTLQEGSASFMLW